MRVHNFFISKRDGLIVIGFTNELGRNSLEDLGECLEQIRLLSFRRAILDLRSVPNLSLIALPSFARILIAIRHNAADLRLCGLHPPVARMLLEQGLVRFGELTKDLLSALGGYPARATSDKTCVRRYLD